MYCSYIWEHFQSFLYVNSEVSHFVFQTLLRAKENEVQYLKKEISCLQNEVQSLTKVYFMFRPLELSKITHYICTFTTFIKRSSVTWL